MENPWGQLICLCLVFTLSFLFCPELRVGNNKAIGSWLLLTKLWLKLSFCSCLLLGPENPSGLRTLWCVAFFTNVTILSFMVFWGFVYSDYRFGLWKNILFCLLWCCFCLGNWGWFTEKKNQMSLITLKLIFSLDFVICSRIMVSWRSA